MSIFIFNKRQIMKIPQTKMTWCLCFIVVSSILYSGCGAQLTPADSGLVGQEVVKTNYGLVRGTTDGKVVKFMGIPYAKPPTGE